MPDEAPVTMMVFDCAGCGSDMPGACQLPQRLPIFAAPKQSCGRAMRRLVAVRRVLSDALGHFNTDDGWAMASHLAISALMALLQFLSFATTLASFLGAPPFAD